MPMISWERIVDAIDFCLQIKFFIAFTCKRVDGGDTTKHICMVARRNSSRLAFKSFGSLGATVVVGEVIAICFRGLMRLFKLLEEVVRDGGGGEDEVTVVVGIKGFKLRTTLKDMPRPVANAGCGGGMPACRTRDELSSGSGIT
uniref:Uncharacterized protein n=1 Tax=Glossina austeni TaxID=7395 RepID=A0A1A9UQR5_GLOAU